MTQFRRVTADATWALLGQASPMVAAFFSIPPLMRGLGEDRFGILALAWVVIGYFSFLDLGLGRALTQIAASRLEQGREAELPEFVGSALLALGALGLVGGVALILLSEWIVGRFLVVPVALRGEATWAFWLMGASVPLVTVTSALRGLVEARRWFAQLNLIRIPLGLLTFLGPWIAIQFSPRLVSVVGVLVGARLAGAIAHAWLTRAAYPRIRLRWALSPPALRRLLSMGGWMTVTNVVGPLMVYLDRFVVGAMVSLAAVAYYATPYEMVTKLLVVGSALSGVLFPVVSAAAASKDTAQVRALHGRVALLLFSVLVPITIAVVVGARWGLTLWISAPFAAESTPVLQVLAVGVLLNAYASIPFTIVQGLGRPDLTAMLHLVELPMYLALVWGLIGRFGIRGAAWAWTARVAVDALALVWMTRRLLRAGEGAERR